MSGFLNLSNFHFINCLILFLYILLQFIYRFCNIIYHLNLLQRYTFLRVVFYFFTFFLLINLSGYFGQGATDISLICRTENYLSSGIFFPYVSC